MLPVARVGDTHICGNPNHPPNVIVAGGSQIVDGKPVARVGDACACGCTITSGSSQASDGGRAIAYLGSSTSSGGSIVSGSGSVKVLP